MMITQNGHNSVNLIGTPSIFGIVIELSDTYRMMMIMIRMIMIMKMMKIKYK